MAPVNNERFTVADAGDAALVAPRNGEATACDGRGLRGVFV